MTTLHDMEPATWPVRQITISRDGRVQLDGQNVEVPTGVDPDHALIARIAQENPRQPVLAHFNDASAGQRRITQLTIYPDGAWRVDGGELRTSPVVAGDDDHPQVAPLTAAEGGNPGTAPVATTGQDQEQHEPEAGHTRTWNDAVSSGELGRGRSTMADPGLHIDPQGLVDLDPQVGVPAEPAADPLSEPASAASNDRLPVPAAGAEPSLRHGREARPAKSLSTSPLYTPPAPSPTRGWQYLLYRMTGGLINPGLSKRERLDNQLIERIRTPLNGQMHRFATVCFKGGIGKTSALCGIGLTLGRYRADPVFIGDFNPDDGDLAHRLTGHEGAGVTSLMEAVKAGQVKSLVELSRYTQSAERLTFLPGEPDPEEGAGMNSAEFDQVMDVIEKYYGLIGIDTAEGVTRPIMPGIFRRVDSVVIAAGHSSTGANKAIKTLDWLRSHGYAHLADNAIVALSAKDGVSRRMDTKRAIESVRERCRVLVVVPADPHLGDGDAINLDLCRPSTRRAFRELAAAVTDGFSRG